MNECSAENCGQPTRDAAYVCDDCGDSLSRALGDIPWLTEELEVTISRQKGVDYRSVGGSSTPTAPKKEAGDRPDLGAHVQVDALHWGASEARAHLKARLVSWALFCEAGHVRNSSPSDDMPTDDLPALSRWLMWRVDGLTLHELGPDAVDEITSDVAHCHRLIDRPADQQYLGDCTECESGRLYARSGSDWARCDACDVAVPAQQVRTDLLSKLDDRLCTAAEIARLSTYLGLKADRDTVRKRINQWSTRGLLTAHPSITDEVTFRFGEVYAKLAAAEYGQKAG